MMFRYPDQRLLSQCFIKTLVVLRGDHTMLNYWCFLLCSGPAHKFHSLPTPQTSPSNAKRTASCPWHTSERSPSRRHLKRPLGIKAPPAHTSDQCPWGPSSLEPVATLTGGCTSGSTGWDLGGTVLTHGCHSSASRSRECSVILNPHTVTK